MPPPWEHYAIARSGGAIADPPTGEADWKGDAVRRWLDPSIPAGPRLPGLDRRRAEMFGRWLLTLPPVGLRG